jgi:hypothetical protein
MVGQISEMCARRLPLSSHLQQMILEVSVCVNLGLPRLRGSPRVGAGETYDAAKAAGVRVTYPHRIARH